MRFKAIFVLLIMALLSLSFTISANESVGRNEDHRLLLIIPFAPVENKWTVADTFTISNNRTP
ncbi:MAG: hypothetical protein V2A69_00395 [Pseudomonadota bacterium]